MAGKGDIFGVNMQEVYLSKRLMTSVAGQDGAQPVISVTDGHGAAVGKSFYAVTAISYCDLHKISLSDLTATLDVYPEFANQFLYNFYITFNLRQVRSKRVHFRKKNILHFPIKSSSSPCSALTLLVGSKEGHPA